MKDPDMTNVIQINKKRKTQKAYIITTQYSTQKHDRHEATTTTEKQSSRFLLTDTYWPWFVYTF